MLALAFKKFIDCPSWIQLQSKLPLPSFQNLVHFRIRGSYQYISHSLISISFWYIFPSFTPIYSSTNVILLRIVGNTEWERKGNIGTSIKTLSCFQHSSTCIGVKWPIFWNRSIFFFTLLYASRWMYNYCTWPSQTY